MVPLSLSPATPSQVLGLRLDPQKVPGAQRTNVANRIWPGLVSGTHSEWGYKKPRHHLIAVSSKKESFSLYIPAEDKLLPAAQPRREQEERRKGSPQLGGEGRCQGAALGLAPW